MFSHKILSVGVIGKRQVASSKEYPHSEMAEQVWLLSVVAADLLDASRDVERQLIFFPMIDEEHTVNIRSNGKKNSPMWPS